MIQVAVANEQHRLEIDAPRLRAAVEAVFAGEGRRAATVSVAIVDDAAIHAVNRQFLDHDYPTDVISFVLDEDDETLDGEIVASADTALAQAEKYGWSAADELLLYVIHGALHLVGYDDLSDEKAVEMRAAERRYLDQLGVARAAEGGVR